MRTNPQCIEFGPFVLDPRSRTLTRDGMPILLGGRALDILVVLATTIGETVGKHVLLDRVWPDQIVEENNLQVHISALRKVLGESAIVTIPGRGYRLTPLQPENNDVLVSDADSEGPSIAILPFNLFASDLRWARFCDGLVEDIITSLSRQRDFPVIARQSSSMYRGKPVDIREIGRSLGARYILEGSVQAEAGHLKVSVQLVNAESGRHVWANSYNRCEADLFAIQEDIVDQVIAAMAGLTGVVFQAELARIRRKPPANLHAYELYLLGYEQEARLDREGTLKSVTILESALKADPHLSRAWTVLAWALGNAIAGGWATDVQSTLLRRREAIIQAVRLDPGDGLAVVGLAMLQAREGNLAGACVSVKRALAVGSNHADTLAFLSRLVMTILDRPDEALRLIERSFILNPHAPWYYLHHIRAAYFMGQAHKVLDYYAILAADVMARENPLLPQKLFRALALSQLRRTAEAEDAIREIRALDPDLRTVWAEAVGLCPNVREVYVKGLQLAGLDDALAATGLPLR